MSMEELSALPRFFFFLCQNVSDFDILMMLYLRQRTREKSKDGGISMKNFEEIIAENCQGERNHARKCTP